jgi:hypothetical protein
MVVFAFLFAELAARQRLQTHDRGKYIAALGLATR